MSNIPPTIAANAISVLDAIDHIILWVPVGSREAYRQAENWKKFKHIYEYGEMPDAITEIQQPAIVTTEIYDLNGRQCATMEKPGIYLILQSDGSVRKKVVK